MMKSQSSLTVLKVLTGEEYEEPVSVTAAILTLNSPRDGRNWRLQLAVVIFVRLTNGCKSQGQLPARDSLACRLERTQEGRRFM